MCLLTSIGIQKHVSHVRPVLSLTILSNNAITAQMGVIHVLEIKALGMLSVVHATAAIHLILYLAYVGHNVLHGKHFTIRRIHADSALPINLCPMIQIPARTVALDVCLVSDNRMEESAPVFLATLKRSLTCLHSNASCLAAQPPLSTMPQILVRVARLGSIWISSIRSVQTALIQTVLRAIFRRRVILTQFAHNVCPATKQTQTGSAVQHVL
jgi:hypothetical protein